MGEDGSGIRMGFSKVLYGFYMTTSLNRHSFRQ